MIQKTRFRFDKIPQTTPTFLRTLGIKFHRPKKGERNFWVDNFVILPDLYRAMQEAARPRLHELHPDKGGNGAEFIAFLKLYNAAKKGFRLHLAVPIEDDQIIIAPPGAVEKSANGRMRLVSIDERREKERARCRIKTRKYYQEHKHDPEFRRKMQEQANRWRKANPDRHNASGKRWQKANPDKVKAKQIRYRNTEKWQIWKAAYNKRRREKRRLLREKLLKLAA